MALECTFDLCYSLVSSSDSSVNLGPAVVGGFSPVLSLALSPAVPDWTLLHRPWDWLACCFVTSRSADDRPCYCDLVGVLWDSALSVTTLPAEGHPRLLVHPVSSRGPVFIAIWHLVVNLSSFSLLTTKAGNLLT